MYKRFLKIIIRVACGVASLLVFTVALAFFIIRDFYVEKNLKDGYFLTIWAREQLVIDYRKGFMSENHYPILFDYVSKVESSRQWIFVESLSGNYWVIDKSIPYEHIPDEENHMKYATSVLGPMDSVSFFHFKDSVGFQAKEKDIWTLDAFIERNRDK